LGFRDLHLFNVAMLARQGWRLIMNPDSLCARVLRAKYFPNGELLHVKEKPGISYSWRSIVRGIEAMKEGLIWRVGDGSLINIWSDPWIPDGVTRRPITPRGHTLLSRVSELIDKVTGAWDKQLIKEVFWEEDVNRILEIPIKHDMEDLLAWHYDNKGLFSVKSAYHVLDDRETRDSKRQQGESSSSVNQPATKKFNWKSIWKLQCPPKIKHFFWRFTHNSLPLRCNIRRRGMKIDTRCLVCQRLDEDGGHCFLKYKFIKHCWQAAGIEEIRGKLCNLSTAQLVSEHILALKEEEKLLVIGLLWSWWDARNKVNAGEQLKSVNDIVYRARSVMTQIAETGKVSRPMEVVNQQRWQKPPEGSWKINVDGAFWDREKKGAWGFVVRDDQGNAVLAGAGSLMSISDALIAETHACIAALQAAADHGLQNIVLESDSLILVRALQSDLYDRARGGMLFREAKYIMAMNFNTVIAVHTPRSCNVVAHTLAQFGGVRDQIILLIGCIVSLNL